MRVRESNMTKDHIHVCHKNYYLYIMFGSLGQVLLSLEGIEAILHTGVHFGDTGRVLCIERLSLSRRVLYSETLLITYFKTIEFNLW